MVDSPTSISDGRRNRRERNREAVVDAVIDLVAEVSDVPPVEVIADRAGVSVSSVFRYFDGIEDLKDEAIERYFTRYAPLFEVPHIGEGSCEERISAFVDARVHLYAAIAPIGRLARARAGEQIRMAHALARARALFIGHIRQHFAQELATYPVGEADDLVALVDSVTSFESWELQHAAHDRSDEQIRRAWTTGLRRLLAD